MLRKCRKKGERNGKELKPVYVIDRD